MGNLYTNHNRPTPRSRIRPRNLICTIEHLTPEPHYPNPTTVTAYASQGILVVRYHSELRGNLRFSSLRVLPGGTLAAALTDGLMVDGLRSKVNTSYGIVARQLILRSLAFVKP